ncbi:MAG: glycosyltransferase family 9 protein [Ignavibacteriales bacterium]|nr:glycosyltransferase family 9 protein [Ignavibacteriales bacterium]
MKKQFAELVRHNPHLSRVIEFDADGDGGSLGELGAELRRQRYDLVLDLHNNLRTIALRILSRPLCSEVITKHIFRRWMLVRWKRGISQPFLHAVDRYFETLRSYGIHADDKGLEIFLPDDIVSRVKGVITAHFGTSGRTIIGMCPGARHFTKRWPWDKYAETAENLLRDGAYGVLLLGGYEEKDLCDRIASGFPANSILNLAGSLSILESAAAMDCCSVVLTNDSGLMHLAAARRRSVVALFGSTTRELGFFPYGTESVVVEQQDLPCRPCSHIGGDHCPEAHFRCMLDIHPERVAVEVTRWSAPDTRSN